MSHNPVSPTPTEAMRASINALYTDSAHRICRDITQHPDTPIPAANLRSLREGIERIGDPGGGTLALRDAAMHALHSRVEALRASHQSDPAFNPTRTDHRAISLLEQLMADHDEDAFIAPAKTAREDRLARRRVARHHARVSADRRANLQPDMDKKQFKEAMAALKAAMKSDAPEAKQAVADFNAGVERSDAKRAAREAALNSAARATTRNAS
jgi:hypothetical protein